MPKCLVAISLPGPGGLWAGSDAREHWYLAFMAASAQ